MTLIEEVSPTSPSEDSRLTCVYLNISVFLNGYFCEPGFDFFHCIPSFGEIANRERSNFSQDDPQESVDPRAAETWHMLLCPSNPLRKDRFAFEQRPIEPVHLACSYTIAG